MCGRIGAKYPTTLQQISVGGCLVPCREDLYPGDEFRLEIQLPNGNFVPLSCRAIYRVDEMGIGAKFLDITKFEQELVARIIRARMESDDLPAVCDPMEPAGRSIDRADPLKITDRRAIRESMLEEVMASDLD
jgi:hypothetical protein